MRKQLLIIVTSFLIIPSIIAQNNSISGRWIGDIVKDNKKWSTELNISAENGLMKGYFDLPDYGLYHLVFDTIILADDRINLGYKDKNDKVNFTGTRACENISGDWEGIGVKASFSLHRISNKPIELQAEEVSFYNNDVKLAGTLILPSGKGPFSAVIQVHGSGNQTRSEDFYRSRAYLFAKNGIATLIYDRRAKGESTGKDVSMALLADDAIAGIHFLQHHSKIKKNQVGIMGFSQGGYIGPFAASRSKDVAFIIAGSAPGITPDGQNDFDVENALKNRNVSEDTVSYVLNFRADLRKYQYNNIGDKTELESRLNILKKKNWFRSTLLTDQSLEPVSNGVKEFLTFDPIKAWEKIQVPVLLIWGALDDVVPVEKSKMYIEQALIKAGNKNYTLKIFPSSSHGIAFISNSKEWDWPRLADGYHSLLVSWAKQTIANLK